MPSRQLHEGGGSWWACWQDTFWLGRWLLSLQPPPLPTGQPRQGGQQADGPSYPSSIRVEKVVTQGCERAQLAGELVGSHCPAAATPASAAPGQICLSITEGRVAGIKFHQEEHSLNLRGTRPEARPTNMKYRSAVTKRSAFLIA